MIKHTSDTREKVKVLVQAKEEKTRKGKNSRTLSSRSTGDSKSSVSRGREEALQFSEEKKNQKEEVWLKYALETGKLPSKVTWDQRGGTARGNSSLNTQYYKGDHPVRTSL